MRADFGAAMGLMHGLLLLTKHGAKSAFAYFAPIDTALQDPGAEATKQSMARRIALEGREAFGQFFSGLRAAATDPDAPLFPKLGALDRIVREHFQAGGSAQATGDEPATSAEQPAGGGAEADDVAAADGVGPDTEHAGGAAAGVLRSTTCVIVFTSFRDSVFEITGHLKRFEPLGVRATHFIGQGGGKKGGSGKGQTQKEQRETVERFRTGMRAMPGLRALGSSPRPSACPRARARVGASREHPGPDGIRVNARFLRADCCDRAARAARRRVQRARVHVHRRGGARHRHGRLDRLLRHGAGAHAPRAAPRTHRPPQGRPLRGARQRGTARRAQLEPGHLFIPRCSIGSIARLLALAPSAAGSLGALARQRATPSAPRFALTPSRAPSRASRLHLAPRRRRPSRAPTLRRTTAASKTRLG